MHSITPSFRYDQRSIMLHWLSAALVAALWALGQTIDWFPKGDPRGFARSLHVVLGLALALVLVARLWWRLRAGAQLPPARTTGLDRIATLTHKLLYLLLAGVVLLGLANVWVRGDTLFNALTIPAFDPGNKALRETVEDWHGLTANVLLIVALLHAAAGLLHHFVFKDDVLRRMLPTTRPPA
jgi:cytochrome b561